MPEVKVGVDGVVEVPSKNGEAMPSVPTAVLGVTPRPGEAVGASPWTLRTIPRNSRQIPTNNPFTSSFLQTPSTNLPPTPLTTPPSPLTVPPSKDASPLLSIGVGGGAKAVFSTEHNRQSTTLRSRVPGETKAVTKSFGVVGKRWDGVRSEDSERRRMRRRRISRREDSRGSGVGGGAVGGEKAIPGSLRRGKNR